MKRWVFAHRTISGDPEQLGLALSRDGMGLLEEQVESTGPQGTLVDLRSRVAGLDVAKKVRVRTGEPDRIDRVLLLPVTWQAEPAGRLFPTFTGALELEPLGANRAQLTLFGSYVAPFGPVGAAGDATVFRRVARETAEAILRDLAAALEESAEPGEEPVAAGPSAEAPADEQERITTAPSSPLRVRDVMSPQPVVIDEHYPLRTAAMMLFNAGISGAPVMSDEGRVIGVLSETDLLPKVAARPADPRNDLSVEASRVRARTVSEACTRPARTIRPDAVLSEAARRMLDADVGRLVVVDGADVVGIIARHDVIGALLLADAEIERSARAATADVAGRDVEVRVHWGEAVLSGVIADRATLTRLVEAVQAVDGVVLVDAEGVSWDRDAVDVPLGDT